MTKSGHKGVRNSIHAEEEVLGIMIHPKGVAEMYGQLAMSFYWE